MHRIPRLQQISASLMEAAADATDMGEYQLAERIITAVGLAEKRMIGIRRSSEARQQPDSVTPAPESPKLQSKNSVAPESR